MIESVRKTFVTLRAFQVNHTETIFRCGNLGNVEIFHRHKRVQLSQLAASGTGTPACASFRSSLTWKIPQTHGRTRSK
jgi:hypothetical protein